MTSSYERHINKVELNRDFFMIEISGEGPENKSPCVT